MQQLLRAAGEGEESTREEVEGGGKVVCSRISPERYLLWVAFFFSAFTFVLGVLCDYAIADWWLVQLPHSTPAMHWYLSFSTPIVGFVKYVGLASIFTSYGILSFGLTTFGAFVASVLLLFYLKLKNSPIKAFCDSFLLYGGISLLLFEAGIMVLDPGEFFVHVTNFTWKLMPWLTNEVVLYAGYAAFSLGFVIRLYLRFKKPAVAPRGANG